MIKKEINIVWLKRDFRSQDHEPLFRAEKSGQFYLIIYIYEPSLINHFDTSNRHLQFIYHSIQALDMELLKYNRSVDVFYGEALDVFLFFNQYYTIKNIFSYRESGIEKHGFEINVLNHSLKKMILCGLSHKEMVFLGG